MPSKVSQPAGLKQLSLWKALPGPRLVEQVVADHVGVVVELRRHAPPRRGVEVLEPAARGRGVGPEVVERPVEARVDQVVVREPGLRLRRDAVVEHLPVGPALALKALVVEVLVEVEEAEDAPVGEDGLGLRDAADVAAAVLGLARMRGWLGLEPLVDDPEPHGVEPLAAQELGVVGAEARVRGTVGADLVDHVDAVQDDHAALGVDEPVALVGQRGLGRGAGDCRERQRAERDQQPERRPGPDHGADASATADMASTVALARPRTTVTSRAVYAASRSWASSRSAAATPTVPSGSPRRSKWLR